MGQSKSGSDSKQANERKLLALLCTVEKSDGVMQGSQKGGDQICDVMGEE